MSNKVEIIVKGFEFRSGICVKHVEINSCSASVSWNGEFSQWWWFLGDTHEKILWWIHHWNYGEFCSWPDLQLISQNMSGALGNGLKRLESAKVGFVAHSMHNYIRNMTGTLFLMSDGLIMSKLRILDSIWKRNFNLEGIRVWREIWITDLSHARTTATTRTPCWCHFCESRLQTLFRAPLWPLCHHFQPECVV